MFLKGVFKGLNEKFFLKNTGKGSIQEVFLKNCIFIILQKTARIKPFPLMFFWRFLAWTIENTFWTHWTARIFKKISEMWSPGLDRDSLYIIVVAYIVYFVNKLGYFAQVWCSFSLIQFVDGFVFK